MADPYENNPTGKLLIEVAWSLWTVTTLILFLRLYIRQRQMVLWWDDAVLVFSFLLLTVHVALIQSSVFLGHGSDLTKVDPKIAPRLDIIMRVNYIPSFLAITFSKLAFGLTLLRLLPAGAWRRMVIALGALLTISCIPTFVLPFLQCIPVPIPKNDPVVSGCTMKPNLSAYIITFSIVQALIDFAFAIIAVKTLMKLKMRLAEKLGLIVAMSLGLLSGIMAIVKAWFISQTYDVQIRPAFTIPIIAVAETVTAIIAASMPVLRVLLRRGLNRYGRGSRSGLSHSDGQRNTHHMVTLSSGGKGSGGGFFENDIEEIRLTNVERN